MEYPFKNLLPLDEVLEREGYYKDWTHLDPKVFYSLTQISEYIKTKGFGVDVRLLIAQLAEHFSLKTSQINDIERLFNDVMKELSEDKDFHSLPEIAGARGGFDTLGERLNDTTTRLAQTHNEATRKRRLEDLSGEVLGAIEGGGGTEFNLLSIPQDGSVTLAKTKGDFIVQGNFYDKNRDLINGYIHSDGHFIVSESTRTAEVNVIPEKTFSILRPAGNSYGTGFGQIQLLNSGGDLVQSIIGSEYINGTYNGLNYITVTLPQDVTKIRITVLLGAMDSVDGLVVSQGSSIDADSYGKPELIRLFDIGIKDEVAREGLKNIAGGSYNNKKWVAFGDSLTERNSKSSQFYHDYIREELNLEVVNMGSGGSGYKLKEDTGFAFYQRISDVPKDADFITIFGSLNDSAADAPIGNASDVGTDTIAGCVNKTMDNLYSVNPIIPLGIIAPTPWNSSVLSDENNRHTQYARMLKAVCENRGIPFLDLYFESGLRPWESSYREIVYSNDNGNGVHPNEIGHRIIAPKIREFIKTLI